MKTKDNLDINKSFFWNQKYTNNQDKWDLNKPTPILKNRFISFDTNNKLKICIPGCGKGHDALYLASIGHEVYAIDFSSNALSEKGKQVERGFEYQSGTNPHFLTVEEIKQLL